MFWNDTVADKDAIIKILTVNMKCFEIFVPPVFLFIYFKINRKHEMFWNL